MANSSTISCCRQNLETRAMLGAPSQSESSWVLSTRSRRGCQEPCSCCRTLNWQYI